MEEIDFQVVKNTNTLDDHERRIGIQEIKNDNLSEMVAYLKLLSKQSEKQDAQFEKTTEVMQQMNTNLAGLNKEMKEMKEDVNSVVERVDGLEQDKVSRLERVHDRGIEFNLKIVGAITSGLIVAGLIFWFGWK